MNVVGLITFTLTTHRGLSLTKEMLIETFKMNERWPDIVQVILVTVTGFMIMLGFMILFVGFLATGSTRRRVYRHLYSRIAGRISCAIFLGITYALVLFWMIVFAAIVVTTFIFVNFWFMCDNRSAASTKDIDLSQFRFYFPKDIREQTLIIPDHEIKQFCSDYVKYADVMFILATFGCLLVIISLVTISNICYKTFNHF